MPTEDSIAKLPGRRPSKVRPALPSLGGWGLGIAVVVGATVGYLALRWAVRAAIPGTSSVRAELVSSTVTTAYVALSTGAVFLASRHVFRRRQERLLAIALIDPLTGLFNVRHFEERLEAELARSQRYGVPLSLLSIDVDGLKSINDVRGHRDGDLAIVAVAESIRTNLRNTDVAARVGGDEFAILCSHTHGEDAETLANRIRASVRSSGHGALTFRLSVSIGVGSVAGGEGSREDLLAAADHALYEAKRGGRDRVAVPSTIGVIPWAEKEVLRTVPRRSKRDLGGLPEK